jgi:hypothetical protein
VNACPWPGTVGYGLLRRHDASLRTSLEKSGPASYPRQTTFDFRPGLVMNRQVVSGLGRRLIDRHSPFVSICLGSDICPAPFIQLVRSLRLGFVRAIDEFRDALLSTTWSKRSNDVQFRTGEVLMPCNGRRLMKQIDGTHLCAKIFSSLTRVTECGHR